jgi:hypothetical protein
VTPVRKVELISNYVQVVPQSNGAQDIGFGQNVAVSDSYMAVSAIRYDANGQSDSGSLYVYPLDDQGVPVESGMIIIPSDLQAGDLYSDPVKIVGSELITASFTKGPGQVYIYNLEAGHQSETILAPPNGKNGDKFGCSFDMTDDGQYLFIGACGSDKFNVDAGAVYCYRLVDDGYQLYHLLEPPKDVMDAGFGRYIEIAGDQLIVGSQNSNSVYIFDILTLQVEDVIAPASSGAPVMGFGVPIDVYEDVMVVGARDSFRGLGCGLVYHTADGTDWTYQGIIIDRSFTSRGLGISVSVGDDFIAISPNQTTFYGRPDQGSVTLYEYTTTSSGVSLEYNSTIAIDSGQAGDFFGKRVTIDNGNLYSTALYDDNSNGIDAGSVYVIPLAAIS